MVSFVVFLELFFFFIIFCFLFTKRKKSMSFFLMFLFKLQSEHKMRNPSYLEVKLFDPRRKFYVFNVTSSSLDFGVWGWVSVKGEKKERRRRRNIGKGDARKSIDWPLIFPFLALDFLSFSITRSLFYSSRSKQSRSVLISVVWLTICILSSQLVEHTHPHTHTHSFTQSANLIWLVRINNIELMVDGEK